jgi:hypothetical protein
MSGAIFESAHECAHGKIVRDRAHMISIFTTDKIKSLLTIMIFIANAFERSSRIYALTMARAWCNEFISHLCAFVNILSTINTCPAFSTITLVEWIRFVLIHACSSILAWLVQLTIVNFLFAIFSFKS